MKKIILIIVAISYYSCVKPQNSKEALIIPSKGVGKFILGEKLKYKYNKEELEIKTSSKDNTISEIIVKSDNYRTKDGFGVGSNLKNIKVKLGDTQTKLQLNKGNIGIGTAGNGLFYNGIWFIDTNKDDVVDGVWLIMLK